jgi:hypothetical protein
MMLRTLAKIQVYGSKRRLTQLEQNGLIPNGVLRQIGLARRVPDVDSWSYSSLWYEFPLVSFNLDVAEFLCVHEVLGLELGKDLSDIRFAALTICPVNATELDQFGGIFDPHFLRRLAVMNLALEIAPAQVMPHAPLWQVVPR